MTQKYNPPDHLNLNCTFAKPAAAEVISTSNLLLTLPLTAGETTLIGNSCQVVPPS